jgi:transaldolase
MKQLATLDISIDEITKELEDEGVEKFAVAFTRLLDTIEARRKEVA